MKKVPRYWRGIPQKRLDYALKFGLIKWGWTLKNYVQHAIEHQGYETILDWGVQGSGKSNDLMQQGYWVFEDWDKVLGNMVQKPLDFVNKLKDIPFGKRTPWIGWDDVGVHFPSVSWRTEIEQYEAVDATWTAIRTKCNVISLNIPLIDRLAKNPKDNVTVEVFIGRNQMRLVERYVRLPGLKRLESNFSKIQIEPIHKFELFDVPKGVFKEYWQTRLELTEEALDRLGNVLTKTELKEVKEREDYFPAIEATKTLHISPRTLLDICRSDLVRAQKIDGRFHIHKEDYATIKDYYLRKKTKT